jgi:hypothetical protein
MIAQSIPLKLVAAGLTSSIPNRVVKPCADGTAVMWESMSSPFFKTHNVRGFFVHQNLFGLYKLIFLFFWDQSQNLWSSEN